MKRLTWTLIILFLVSCSREKQSQNKPKTDFTGTILFERRLFTLPDPIEIFLFDPTSSLETQVTNFSVNGTKAIASHTASWSPDKTKIVFTSQKDATVTAPHSQVYLKDVQGNSITRVTNGLAHSFNPKYSPDSKRIAFIRITESGGNDQIDLYVINADGTNEIRLTNFTANGILLNFVGGLCWLDNNNLLFTSSKQNGACDLYSINLSTPTVHRITTSIDIYGEISLSPDGSEILYTKYKVPCCTGGELFKIKVDGTAEKQLSTYSVVNSKEMDAEHASWTSDGRILFISRRDNDFGEIYIMNADGTNVTRLTNNNKNEMLPRSR